MKQRRVLKSTIVGLAVVHQHGIKPSRPIKLNHRRATLDAEDVESLIAKFAGRPNCHNCNGG